MPYKMRRIFRVALDSQLAAHPQQVRAENNFIGIGLQRFVDGANGVVDRGPPRRKFP
jgi:hypothetical protein